MLEQDTDIVFNREVAPATFLMGFHAPEIVAKARPGQFVMVRTRRGPDPLLRRPFSICGTRKKSLLLILYRVVGRGTSILSRTTEGERLSVMGPLGNFFELPNIRRKPVLVAGGMGTAPLLFLAQAIGTKNLIFLAGYRSLHEIPGMDLIRPAGLNISIATDEGSAGYHGLVTELLEDWLKGLSDRDIEIFTCGPMAMIKSVSSIALAGNIPCQVSLETAMACGVGACQGCVVKTVNPDLVYARVCKEGPVFYTGVLDWECL